MDARRRLSATDWPRSPPRTVPAPAGPLPAPATARRTPVPRRRSAPVPFTHDRGEVVVASVNWRKRGKRYLVYWRLDDGSQGGKTVGTKDEALLLAAEKRLELARSTWTTQQKGKRPFGEWGDTWWDLWSSNPDLSPNTIETTRIQYRKHVRPFFERQQIRSISPTFVRRWQNRLQATTGWQSVMASRSILFRVLELAEDEGAIPTNPVRKVPAPKRPIDPEVILGTAKRRAPTPEEAGILLAFFPDFWWDHVITLLGTGMRFGELAGLRRRRVDRLRRCVQVVATRYQAGQAGSGPTPTPRTWSSPARAAAQAAALAGSPALASRAALGRCSPATTSAASTSAPSIAPARPPRTPRSSTSASAISTCTARTTSGTPTPPGSKKRASPFA